MQDKGLEEYMQFTGEIGSGGHAYGLTFRARIRDDGEIEFDFGTLPICDENRFVRDQWQGNAKSFAEFALKGVANDGTSFHTPDLIFTSLKESWNKDSGRRMNPQGECSTGTFRRPLASTVNEPLLRMRLKGFRNFGPLSATCPLGTVQMAGEQTVENPNVLTGEVLVRSDHCPSDPEAWRAEADKLLDHVRRVMSLASAVVLHAPITEYFFGDEAEVVAWSQTVQSASAMRTVHYLEQKGIFSAAVASHFAPPFEVKNIYHAIEWFAMDATYNEVKLINAMTVLENLVASNLNDSESFIRPEKEFEKTRRALRITIRGCIEKWGTEDSALAVEIVRELNERLGDLNRRSLLTKLRVLVQQWSIPLDGISDEQITRAKRARDHIVHTGRYEDDGELWDHVSVIREIVVRFLFAAIGYSGNYISFVGGMHHAFFPPPPEKNGIGTEE